MNEKIKIIYSRNVAIKLINLGFVPNQIIPNPYKPNLNCWLFSWDNNIAEALTAITKEMKGYEVC